MNPGDGSVMLIGGYFGFVAGALLSVVIVEVSGRPNWIAQGRCEGRGGHMVDGQCAKVEPMPEEAKR